MRRKDKSREKPEDRLLGGIAVGLGHRLVPAPDAPCAPQEQRVQKDRRHQIGRSADRGKDKAEGHRHQQQRIDQNVVRVTRRPWVTVSIGTPASS